jgi:hypothetical protein
VALAKIFYPKIVPSRGHLLVGKRTTMAEVGEIIKFLRTSFEKCKLKKTKQKSFIHKKHASYSA